MENFTTTIKRRIAQFLNKATAVVVYSYERYLGSDLPEGPDDEAKAPEAFKKFHEAGKSAASHLESLLKLADATADPAEAERDRQNKAREAMQKAHDELHGD